jgi:hypothetical protein
MKKIFNTIIVGALALLSLTSCQRDLTSLNVDPKNPTILPSENLLAMGQNQFFYYTHTGSVNFNNFRFFVQQWTETTYTDETNYNLVTRNQPRNNWNRMYVYSLNNFETAKKNLASEGGSAAVKQNRMATLEISQIAVWQTLVDTYGDVPYSEALKADEAVFSPKYDDAKTIYADLLTRINTVITKIDVSSPGYGSGDLVYGGNMGKWRRLANSIKLRLAINLVDVDAAAAKTAAEAAVASGVMASQADSYSLKFSGGTFNNPIYDDVIASGRADFIPSEQIINFMNTKNDPRRSTWFTKVGGNFVGGIFGSLNSYANYSHFQDFLTVNNAPANLLSYTEVLFLKAEAAQRGYAIGGTAASFYDAAIKASMEENQVATADAAAYLAANPYNAVNWKKSIGEQAWVAFFNSPFAAWNFSRRLDNPAFVNPSNSQTDGVPVRMPYSDQEYVLNKTNVEAAASKIGGDKATTKLFWDKF